MPEIKITIDKKTFEVETEGFGFQGRECLATSDALNEVLGATTVSQRMKDRPVEVKRGQQARRK